MPGTNTSVPKSPPPPYRWSYSDFGTTECKPSVEFVDSTGKRCWTDSFEFILASIDLFPIERDRQRLLAGAAVHYGFDDAWILIKGRNA